MTFRTSSERAVRVLMTAGVFASCGWASPASAQAVPPSVRSMTLGEAVEIARERAPQVHAAFARIASAEAGVDRARAAHLPSVSLQGIGNGFTSNGRVYSSGLASSSTSDTYLLAQGTLSLQWTLYDFGRTSSAIDAAAAGVRAAGFSARASEQAAMGEAAVAFFTLLADDALVRSAEEVRADREKVVAITHRLVQSGFRTAVDDARAQVGLEVAELDVTMAQATRDNDTSTLASALMLDPSTSFRLAAPASLEVDESAAGADGIRARRDVAAATARVEQARHELAAAHRAHLPVLAANASGSLLYVHDRASYSASTSGGAPSAVTSDSPTELAQGGITLTLPLFDPLLNAGVKGAEANVGEAQADLERVTRDARTEASQASRQLHNARALLDQSARLASVTTVSLSAMEERYAGGMESPIALADAQRDDALARVAIVRARLALDVAKVRLLAGLSRVDELRKVR